MWTEFFLFWAILHIAFLLRLTSTCSTHCPHGSFIRFSVFWIGFHSLRALEIKFSGTVQHLRGVTDGGPHIAHQLPHEGGSRVVGFNDPPLGKFSLYPSSFRYEIWSASPAATLFSSPTFPEDYLVKCKNDAMAEC